MGTVSFHQRSLRTSECGNSWVVRQSGGGDMTPRFISLVPALVSISIQSSSVHSEWNQVLTSFIGKEVMVRVTNGTKPSMNVRWLTGPVPVESGPFPCSLCSCSHSSPVHIHFVHWAKSEEQNSRNKVIKWMNHETGWEEWTKWVEVNPGFVGVNGGGNTGMKVTEWPCVPFLSLHSPCSLRFTHFIIMKRTQATGVRDRRLCERNRLVGELN